MPQLRLFRNISRLGFPRHFNRGSPLHLCTLSLDHSSIISPANDPLPCDAGNNNIKIHSLINFWLYARRSEYAITHACMGSPCQNLVLARRFKCRVSPVLACELYVYNRGQLTSVHFKNRAWKPVSRTPLSLPVVNDMPTRRLRTSINTSWQGIRDDDNLRHW